MGSEEDTDVTELNSACLMLSKVSLLTSGCGKEKYRAPSKENRQLVFKRIKNFLMALRPRFLKAILRVRVAGCMIRS